MEAVAILNGTSGAPRTGANYPKTTTMVPISLIGAGNTNACANSLLWHGPIWNLKLIDADPALTRIYAMNEGSGSVLNCVDGNGDPVPGAAGAIIGLGDAGGGWNYVDSNWILLNGIWSDTGVWEDNALWVD